MLQAKKVFIVLYRYLECFPSSKAKKIMANHGSSGMDNLPPRRKKIEKLSENTFQNFFLAQKSREI